jgi:sec-independent protein translocase protein TatA
MTLLTSHPLIAFGIPSGPDMFIIAVLVLVLFGAKKLPVFARSLGRSMGEFRKAKEEFEQELHSAASSDPLPPTGSPRA